MFTTERTVNLIVGAIIATFFGASLTAVIIYAISVHLHDPNELNVGASVIQVMGTIAAGSAGALATMLAKTESQPNKPNPDTEVSTTQTVSSKSVDTEQK